MSKQDQWNSKAWYIRKRNLIKGRLCFTRSNLYNILNHSKESEFSELSNEECEDITLIINKCDEIIKDFSNVTAYLAGRNMKENV